MRSLFLLQADDAALPPERLVALQAAASDEHMQLLNLGRRWLVTLLPHLLSKIHRVRCALCLSDLIAQPRSAASFNFGHTKLSPTLPDTI